MRKITISIYLISLFLTASAQSDSLLITSMQEVFRQNSWLEANNPVGMSLNRFRSFSIAEAGYSYRNGNLGNPAIPASSHIYNVYSESFQTLGKTSLYGKLGYTNTRKQNINWHGMTNDYWHGVSLCDSVSGKQGSEQYRLAGAFSLPLSRHWLIGTRFDYLVELTAKDTDPRNKNQWMEWKLTPGLGYQREQFRAGVSLLYTSRKEGVDYQNVSTHFTYPFLVSYPLAFFKTLPLSQRISWNYDAQEIGGALQAEIIHTPFSLFQEITGSATEQNIISNRIQDKKEGNTHSWQIDYRGKLKRTSQQSRHEWSWQAIFNSSKSYEPLQKQEVSTIWTTYGKVHRSSYRVSDYASEYKYDRLRDAWNPCYSVSVGINYHQQKSSLFFHPAEYAQPLHRFSVHSTFTRSFLLPDAQLDCSLGGEYSKGGGEILKEKQLPPDQTAPEIALWQNSKRLQQEFDYQTDPRWNLHLSVTYNHTGSFRWYVRLSAKYEGMAQNPTDTKSSYFSAQTGVFF